MIVRADYARSHALVVAEERLAVGAAMLDVLAVVDAERNETAAAPQTATMSHQSIRHSPHKARRAGDDPCEQSRIVLHLGDHLRLALRAGECRRTWTHLRRLRDNHRCLLWS